MKIRVSPNANDKYCYDKYAGNKDPSFIQCVCESFTWCRGIEYAEDNTGAKLVTDYDTYATANGELTNFGWYDDITLPSPHSALRSSVVCPGPPYEERCRSTVFAPQEGLWNVHPTSWTTTHCLVKPSYYAAAKRPPPPPSLPPPPSPPPLPSPPPSPPPLLSPL